MLLKLAERDPRPPLAGLDPAQARADLSRSVAQVEGAPFPLPEVRDVTVSGAEAMQRSQQLAKNEGIFVGTSSGATFAGTLKLCEDVPQGSTVLCMLPDTGERYLSTPLFADIPADMTDEEKAIAG